MLPKTAQHLERIETTYKDMDGKVICQGDLVKLSYGNVVALVTAMPIRKYEEYFDQKVVSKSPLPENHLIPVIHYKFKAANTDEEKWYRRALTGKVKIVGKVN